MYTKLALAMLAVVCVSTIVADVACNNRNGVCTVRTHTAVQCSKSSITALYYIPEAQKKLAGKEDR